MALLTVSDQMDLDGVYQADGRLRRADQQLTMLAPGGAISKQAILKQAAIRGAEGLAKDRFRSEMQKSADIVRREMMRELAGGVKSGDDVEERFHSFAHAGYLVTFKDGSVYHPDGRAYFESQSGVDEMKDPVELIAAKHAKCVEHARDFGLSVAEGELDTFAEKFDVLGKALAEHVSVSAATAGACVVADVEVTTTVTTEAELDVHTAGGEELGRYPRALPIDDYQNEVIPYRSEQFCPLYSPRIGATENVLRLKRREYITEPSKLRGHECLPHDSRTFELGHVALAHVKGEYSSDTSPYDSYDRVVVDETRFVALSQADLSSSRELGAPIKLEKKIKFDLPYGVSQTDTPVALYDTRIGRFVSNPIDFGADFDQKKDFYMHIAQLKFEAGLILGREWNPEEAAGLYYWLQTLSPADLTTLEEYLQKEVFQVQREKAKAYPTSWLKGVFERVRDGRYQEGIALAKLDGDLSDANWSLDESSWFYFYLNDVARRDGITGVEKLVDRLNSRRGYSGSKIEQKVLLIISQLRRSTDVPTFV